MIIIVCVGGNVNRGKIQLPSASFIKFLKIFLDSVGLPLSLHESTQWSLNVLFFKTITVLLHDISTSVSQDSENTFLAFIKDWKPLRAQIYSFS